MNFAPQDPDSAALRSSDAMALVSVLRRIAREPRFGRFSVVAHNVQEEKVLYRHGPKITLDESVPDDPVEIFHGGSEFPELQLAGTQMYIRCYH